VSSTVSLDKVDAMPAGTLHGLYSLYLRNLYELSL